MKISEIPAAEGVGVNMCVCVSHHPVGGGGEREGEREGGRERGREGGREGGRFCRLSERSPASLCAEPTGQHMASSRKQPP